jgi:hypothetical protein
MVEGTVELIDRYFDGPYKSQTAKDTLLASARLMAHNAKDILDADRSRND